MLTLKFALLSALITLAIWKVRARRNWDKLRNYRRAEAIGRLRLREGSC